MTRSMRDWDEYRARVRAAGRAADDANARLRRIVAESRLRNLIRKVDAVWDGVIWRLVAIGALSVIAAVAGGVLR